MSWLSLNCYRHPVANKQPNNLRLGLLKQAFASSAFLQTDYADIRFGMKPPHHSDWNDDLVHWPEIPNTTRKTELNKLSEVLGVSKPKSNDAYKRLDIALTHHLFFKDPYQRHGFRRLELIGDAVLHLATNGYFIEGFPNKTIGQFTVQSNNLLSNEQFNQIAEDYKLDHYCKRNNNSTEKMSQCFEAVVGALYLNKNPKLNQFIAHIFKKYANLSLKPKTTKEPISLNRPRIIRLKTIHQNPHNVAINNMLTTFDIKPPKNQQQRLLYDIALTDRQLDTDVFFQQLEWLGRSFVKALIREYVYRKFVNLDNDNLEKILKRFENKKNAYATQVAHLLALPSYSLTPEIEGLNEPEQNLFWDRRLNALLGALYVNGQQEKVQQRFWSVIPPLIDEIQHSVNPHYRPIKWGN